MFRDELERLHACEEAVDWVAGRDLATAWRECPRADWMLWLLGSMVGRPGWPGRSEHILAVCACARTALQYVPADEARPLQAIEAAERYAREATPAAASAAASAASAAASAGVRIDFCKLADMSVERSQL